MELKAKEGGQEKEKASRTTRECIISLSSRYEEGDLLSDRNVLGPVSRVLYLQRVHLEMTYGQTQKHQQYLHCPMKLRAARYKYHHVISMATWMDD